MALKIRRVDAENEEVWVETTTSASENLLGHAIVDNTFTGDDKVSNEYRHIYLFPNQIITEKDFVCLHSGDAADRVTNNKGGGKNYHYYWKAKGAVWNNNKRDKAHLINFTVIDTKPAK